MQNFEDAKQSDTALYANFHQKMLQKGVYLPASAFETSFICSPMDSSIIDACLGKAQASFYELQHGV
ncbi:Glutamate-1-semialdehyde aminotransferase [Helicobacter heilmannii ASB1.4]|nr:Glutamate-1-semialdehyde aminotransferase [Helicobacter heilmannii ASB1.4]